MKINKDNHFCEKTQQIISQLLFPAENMDVLGLKVLVITNLMGSTGTSDCIFFSDGGLHNKNLALNRQVCQCCCQWKVHQYTRYFRIRLADMLWSNRACKRDEQTQRTIISCHQEQDLRKDLWPWSCMMQLNHPRNRRCYEKRKLIPVWLRQSEGRREDSMLEGNPES